MKAELLLGAFVPFLLSYASAEYLSFGQEDPNTNTTITTFLRSEDGIPQEVGVMFLDFDANMTLPEADGSHTTFSNNFEFHPASSDTLSPFNFLRMAYSSDGHAAGVSAEYYSEISNWDAEQQANFYANETAYTIPHWDIQFVLVSLSDSSEIQCTSYPPCELDQATEQEFHLPPPEWQLPSGYFMDYASNSPEIGVAWHPDTVFTLRKEFAANPVLNMASHLGIVTAVEVMVSLDTFRAVAEDPIYATIPQAEGVTTSGYYPTAYKIARESGSYVVSLTGFEYREARPDNSDIAEFSTLPSKFEFYSLSRNFSTFVSTHEDSAVPLGIGVRIPDFDLFADLPEGTLSFTNVGADFTLPKYSNKELQDSIPFALVHVTYLSDGHIAGLDKEAWEDFLNWEYSNQTYFYKLGTSYHVPHWDIQFSLLSLEERSEIVCDSFPPCEMSTLQDAKFHHSPPAWELPEGYFMDYAAVGPEWGINWHPAEALPSKDAFRNQSTVMMGSYDGRMTMYQPTVSLDHLRGLKASGKTELVPIPQPEGFRTSGYYPNAYEISYDAHRLEYVIELTDLQYRQSKDLDADNALSVREETSPAYDAYALETKPFKTFVRSEPESEVPIEIGVRIPDFDYYLSLPELDQSYTTIFESLSLDVDHPAEALIPFTFVGVTYLSDGRAAGLTDEDYSELMSSSAQMQYDVYTNGTAYNIPQFNLHFSLVSQDEWDAVECLSYPACAMDAALEAQFYRPPPDWELAEGYFMDYITAGPGWGVTWHSDSVMESRSEFQHAPEFVFSTYGGEVSSYAPTVSLSVLREVKDSGDPILGAIAQPDGFSESGYYPTAYQIAYDEPAQEYIVSLVGLEYRDARDLDEEPNRIDQISPAGAFETFGLNRTFSSYIRTADGSDVPTEVGVRIPDFDLYMNLPENEMTFHTISATLDLSTDYPALDQLPFEFIELEYFSDGHPAGVSREEYEEFLTWDNAAKDAFYVDGTPYNVPQWDIQFFTINEVSANLIDCTTFPPCLLDEARSNQFYHPPDDWEIPEGYFMDYIAVGPEVGVHWHPPYVPYSQDEFNEEPSFMFGSFDGTLHLYEPVIASNNLRALKESGEKLFRPVPRAEGYRKAGYYPTAYEIYYDYSAQDYIVALVGLEYREGKDLDEDANVYEKAASSVSFTDYGLTQKEFETFIRTEEGSDVPTEVGIRIPDFDVFMELPEDEQTFTKVSGTFLFPEGYPALETLPFEYMEVNYHSDGHTAGLTLDDVAGLDGMGPAEVEYFYENGTAYHIAHWDVQFFLIPPEATAEIRCLTYPPCELNEEMESTFYHPPQDWEMPEGYFMDYSAAEQGLGIHWHPQTVLQSQSQYASQSVLMLGSYDGLFDMYEPMISSDNFRMVKDSGEVVYQGIPQPQGYRTSGYYPTAYQFYYDAYAQEYVVSLVGLEYRLGRDLSEVEHVYEAEANSVAFHEYGLNRTISTFVRTEEGTEVPVEAGVRIPDFDIFMNLPEGTGAMLQIEENFAWPQFSGLGSLAFDFLSVEYLSDGAPAGYSQSDLDAMSDEQLSAVYAGETPYNLPRWDIEFFLLPEDQVGGASCLSYPPCEMDDATEAAYLRPPYAWEIPDGYFQDAAAAAPGSGLSWHPRQVLSSTDDFAQESLVMLSSYDGSLQSYKPVLSCESLRAAKEAGERVYREIPQPHGYYTVGYYPAAYQFYYDSYQQEYVISLVGLEYRSAYDLTDPDLYTSVAEDAGFASEGLSNPFTTFVRTEEGTEVPAEVGIRIPEGVVASDQYAEFQLPQDYPGTSQLPFLFIGVNYDADGHAFVGSEVDGEIVYNAAGSAPHWDVRFSLISSEAAAAIPCDASPCTPAAEDEAAIFRPPASWELPDNYFMDEQAVDPYAGVHWTPKAPAAADESSFLFSSFDGELTAYEANVLVSESLAQEAKEGGIVVAKSIPQPQAVRVSGYYPTSYQYYYDPHAREYVVSMAGLRYREGQDLDANDHEYISGSAFVRSSSNDESPIAVGMYLEDFDIFMDLAENTLDVERIPSERFVLPEDYPALASVPFQFAQAVYYSDGYAAGATEYEVTEVEIMGEESKFYSNGTAYNLPRWDFQFYFLPSAESAGIVCESYPPCAMATDIDANARVPPEHWQLPEGYFMDYATFMADSGVTWHPEEVFTSQREFASEPEFIVGSYSGDLSMYEVMVSLETLRAVKESGTSLYRTIPQPQAFKAAGHYPTAYEISYDPHSQRYAVALVGMEYREAAGPNVAEEDEIKDLENRLGVATDVDAVWVAEASYDPEGFFSKYPWRVMVHPLPGAPETPMSAGVLVPNPFTDLALSEDEPMFANLAVPDSEADVIFDAIQVEYTRVGHEGGWTRTETNAYREMSTTEQQTYLEEEGLYYTEHWDFRFFFENAIGYEAAVCDSYPPCDADSDVDEMFYDGPASDLMPGTYFMDDLSSTPGAGIHWHPEHVYARSTLEQRPIVTYGSFDNRVTFVDVVVSADAMRAALKSSYPITVPVPWSEQAPYRGYYPHAAQLFYNANENAFWVALTDMEFRRPGPSTRARVEQLERDVGAAQDYADWQETYQYSSAELNAAVSVVVQNVPGTTDDPNDVSLVFPDFDVDWALPESSGAYGNEASEILRWTGSDALAIQSIEMVYYPDGVVKGLTEEETLAMDWASELGSNTYMTPHFDFIFALVDEGALSRAECTSYPPCDVYSDTTDSPMYSYPEESTLPADVFLDPLSARPGAGVDWHPATVPSSSDFAKKPVFKYGSWAGSIYYWKVSVSLDALRLVKESERPYIAAVPLADSPPVSHYPKKYRLHYDWEEGAYSVALTDFLQDGLFSGDINADDESLADRVDGLEAFMIAIGVVVVTLSITLLIAGCRGDWLKAPAAETLKAKEVP